MAERISFPILTERLSVRPLRIEDSGALHELYSDPVAMQHLASALPSTVDESKRWVEDKIDLHDETGLSLWAVLLSETGEVIGDAGLQLMEDGETVELGVRIVRRLWGHGYGREAAKACVEAGFRELGLRRIVGVTDPDNQAAIRAMSRGGMTNVGLQTHYGREWIVFEVTRT
jgi:RimJ/RimL family protein N-acetyltransferase